MIAGRPTPRFMSGPVFNFEGVGLLMGDDEIRPGDLYLAQRNTGPELLTCKTVDPCGWIVPVELAYSYDTNECRKVLGLAEAAERATRAKGGKR